MSTVKFSLFVGILGVYDENILKTILQSHFIFKNHEKMTGHKCLGLPHTGYGTDGPYSRGGHIGLRQQISYPEPRVQLFGNEFRLRKNKSFQSLGTQHGRRVTKAHLQL